ncbi:MAG: sulfotransferase [Gammaproteobacteria bacterium]|nr:sulfotransferase [Gammaproteobacteria bacterium]
MKNVTLICGLPRSGTTWLGKIFDSHPWTYYLHEPDSVVAMRDIPRVVAPRSNAEYRSRLTDYFSQYLSMNVPKVRGKRPLFPKSYLSHMGSGCYRLSVIAATMFARYGLRVPVYTPVPESDAENVRYVWKSVEAAGRLPVIVAAFPEMRVIYEVRHPCGYISSIVRGIRQGRFARGFNPAEDYDLFRLLLASPLALQRGVTEEFLKSVSELERIAWQWCLINDFILHYVDNASNCMVVRYEDICVSPVETVRKLFDFAKLEWSTQVNDFIHHSSAGGKDQYYGVFRDPKAAMNKWTKDLTQEEIELIVKVVSGSRSGLLYGCK